MSISSPTRKAGPYSGNGSTVNFPFSYKVFQASDVYVVLTDPFGIETVQTLTSQYTVSLNSNQDSNPGGTVTMLAAPASGYLLTLGSQVQELQSLVLTNTGGFYPTTLNDAFDKVTILIQQLQEQVNRSIKTNFSSSIDPNTLLQYITVLYNDLANLNAIANDLANINAVAGDLTNINTVAGSITNVNNVGGSIANVNSVAGDLTNINLVNSNSSNINTVAAAIASVITNATNISAILTNASNISSINTNAANITAIQNASANATAAANSATAAALSATNAGNSTTAAAASAAAAAASAAAGLYRQVLDKSANYTIVAADSGTLFRANTGGGAITFTLPQISTVTDGYRVAVVKWTSDSNQVTVNRAGSDTINGGTTVQIGSQYSQIIFVADFETNTWFASQSGLGATNRNVDQFNGNGVATTATLTADPGSKYNCDVFIGGVHQDHSNFSTSGTTLTFTTAPPSGTNNIQVVYGTPLAIGTPSDGTVSTAKLIDQSVTTAKIADGNVTQTKLSADLQGATYGMKNRIINGAMMIDQRNAGASVTNINGAVYTVDRFNVFGNVAGKFTAQQNAGSVTPPAGFTNYLGITSSSSYSVASSDYFLIRQAIEGYNIADLAWGTANAKAITLSFQVYSSLTGTFGGCLNIGGFTRSYPFSYSIPVANTWTPISITIAGDTGGSWNTTNGGGLYVSWGLGVGSANSGTPGSWQAVNVTSATGATSVVGTNGATFYITGVQLEKGSTATSFDYRPYGTELALCQRYYEQLYFPAVSAGNTSFGYWKVTKRANPTMAYVSGISGANIVALGNDVASQGSYTATGGTSIWSGNSEL